MIRNESTRTWSSATQLLFGLTALALLTWGCVGVGIHLTTTAFAYLILIVLLSLTGSLIPVVGVGVVAVACLNYFFQEPRFTFRVEYPEDLAELAGFLIAALVITGLVRRARRLAVSA